MAKAKKMAFGGLGDIGFKRGTQQPAPNFKNNRLTPAQTAPGAPSGGQMSMPLQQASQNIAPGRLGQGTPQNLPKNLPQDYAQQQANQAMQAAMGANRPPRDMGFGNGPRFIKKTPGSIGANPRFGTGPNDAPQSVMGNLRNTIKNFNPDGGGLGLGNGMAAPENMLQQSPNAASMAQKAARGFGPQFKKGGAVKVSKPKTSSASNRGDGIAQRGKTKGRMV